MDKTTISKYGWVIVATVVAFVLITAAPQIGNKISTTVVDAVTGNTVSYSVTLDANGGLVPYNDALVVAGKPYGYLPTPTCEGKVFVGWYTSAVGGEKISGQTIFNGSDDVLYARWAD